MDSSAIDFWSVLRKHKKWFFFVQENYPNISVYFRFRKYSHLLHFQPCNTGFYTCND